MPSKVSTILIANATSTSTSTLEQSICIELTRMFYEGDLQSGISKALQESKLVACFVTDNGEESQAWENDYLEDVSIKSSLADETVLLRLIAGSQEAAYLAAIFPLPKTPTVVIIQNGQLKEYLAAGILKEEFVRRMRTVFHSRSTASSLDQQSQHTVSTVPRSNGDVTSENSRPDSVQRHTNINRVQVESSPELVQDLHAEGSARLERHKQGQEAKEKAKLIAEAKARKAGLEEETSPDAPKSADMKYALMQKKRREDAREERARILKRVEDDKAERKQKEAQRKAQLKTKTESQDDEPAIASSSFVPSLTSQSRECALQIRLFDGSTIRSRFPSQGSLRANVRPWIDQQQTVDIPYTFKHVLTPYPNKDISISDEEQSFQLQGLTPNATLILVPVKGYTSAYEDGNTPGFMSRGLAAGYDLVSSGVGLVTGVLGSIFAGGGQAADAANNTTVPSTTPSNINVRTLRDQERPEDHQFYNGNALNFEPRNDVEDKKDE